VRTYTDDADGRGWKMAYVSSEEEGAWNCVK